MLAIAPISPANEHTKAPKEFLFMANRSKAGDSLPEYYLVYFLLVELLAFRNLGKWEKLDWSVPIDFKGKAFLVEHRKFGVGVFVQDPDLDEPAARDIVTLIRKGVDIAQPFFVWMADKAVNESKVNVTNESIPLFQRYNYFVQKYRELQEEINNRADERIVEEGTSEDGTKWSTVSIPAFALRRESQWVAQAAIDAFFSWTEHVLIHLAIIFGRLTTGRQVAKLAVANWHEKFALTLDLADAETKQFYDKLSAIRTQLRNFMAHGAFGKRGEAFHFHSGAGAVPVLLSETRGKYALSLTGQLAFEEHIALDTIQQFIEFLWSGVRAPARVYIQESSLPLLLTMASDGTYAKAMTSPEEMADFVYEMSCRFDNAANMDW